MLFQDAYAELKCGKYMTRLAWAQSKDFIVLFPNMLFMWKITGDPQKPNAGVWMASVQDMEADDWMEMAKTIVPHVCEADPA